MKFGKGQMRPGLTVAQNAELLKIDSALADGLDGANNSLSYKVHELEKHFHNREFWIGEHASRNGEIDCAARDTMTPFQHDAGDGSINDVTPGYGTPLCIIGTNDVPFTSDGFKFDLHRLVVVDVEATADLKLHKVQIIFGSGTVAAAISDLQLSDVPPFIPLRGAAFTVMDVMMPRVICGTDKVWLRHWVDGINTGTMDFFVGLHEYKG